MRKHNTLDSLFGLLPVGHVIRFPVHTLSYIFATHSFVEVMLLPAQFLFPLHAVIMICCYGGLFIQLLTGLRWSFSNDGDVLLRFAIGVHAVRKSHTEVSE